MKELKIRPAKCVFCGKPIILGQMIQIVDVDGDVHGVVHSRCIPALREIYQKA